MSGEWKIIAARATARTEGNFLHPAQAVDEDMTRPVRLSEDLPEEKKQST